MNEPTEGVVESRAVVEGDSSLHQVEVAGIGQQLLLDRCDLGEISHDRGPRERSDRRTEHTRPQTEVGAGDLSPLGDLDRPRHRVERVAHREASRAVEQIGHGASPDR